MIKQLFGKSINLLIYSLIFSLFLCEYSYSKEKPLFTEACYLDNSYVLLYKIINWWNDSEPGNDIICGNILKCEIMGISKLQYDSEKALLTISTSSGIEELVSLFKECKSCKGPSYFKCTYLNERYFGKVTAKDTSEIHSAINTIQIQNVAIKQPAQVIDIEEFIVIELEGIVGGLLLDNGKIALHQNGNFLKSCPQSSKSLSQQPKTTVTIKNYDTKEILAKYTAVIDGK